MYGLFTIETMITSAFGSYVDVQRGAADNLAKAAANILSGHVDGEIISPDALLVILCKLHQS